MKILSCRKFLARNLIDARRMQQLRLVDLTGDRLSITPFDRETHSTLFIDSTVLLLQKSFLDESLLSSPLSAKEFPALIDTLRSLNALAYPGLPSSAILPLDLFN